MPSPKRPLSRIIPLIFIALLLTSCSTSYYSAMEKVGVHKRDILVDRVEEARDAQEEAQEEFKSALEQFASVVALKETDLKREKTFKIQYLPDRIFRKRGKQSSCLLRR